MPRKYNTRASNKDVKFVEDETLKDEETSEESEDEDYEPTAEETSEEIEEEVEEEEEEEEMDLKPIEYKGNTYYLDESTSLVYVADEDGAVDPNMPVGKWIAQSKKITRLT